MHFIEQRKQNVLLDRNKSIGQSVQKTINLLIQGGVVQKTQSGLNAQYFISENEYLRANYYSNMVANHFYHRAFIELALIKVAQYPAKGRVLRFWKEIMLLRDLFKFEFFYTNRAQFSDEIEAELALFDPKWRKVLQGSKEGIYRLLTKQNFSVAEPVLLTYLEAYQVVLKSLKNWDPQTEFNKNAFINACIFSGKEMHWQGDIRRLDSVSKPFLINGFRLAKNRKFTHQADEKEAAEIEACANLLEEITERLSLIHI